MRADYVPSIDWLKAIGITLIVFGHVAHGAIAWLVPPIYPKQFGVAMFIYASAYGLARERRDSWRAVANRLFEMFLFGLAIAALLSLIGYVSAGDLRESNYLPFAGGVNVALDYFPANPTTWFIGMYLQMLLLWAVVLRGVRVSAPLIAIVAVGEVALRTVLMERAGDFVAYMNVSNWLTVFLLGLRYGQGGQIPLGRRAWWHAGLPLAAFVIAWSALLGPIVSSDSFPLMRLGDASLAGTLATSVAVTCLYSAVTLMTVATVSMLPATASMRYVARNTVIVFIGHMPIYFALQPILKAAVPSYWLIVAIQMVPCYFGLLWVSEHVRRLVEPAALRDRLLAANQFANPLRLAKVLSGNLPACWQQHLNKVYHRYTIRREQEPSEFGVLRHLVQDGQLIVDAGANVGLYTVFLSRCAPKGSQVLAIEPISTTFDVLSDTVASLGLTNVTLLSCAVSDRPHQVQMEIPASADGQSVHALARITYTDQPRRVAATYHVEARRLDDVLRGDSRQVSLIKFDVEMHELQAITGSLGVIRRDHPAIYVEIQPDLRFKPSQRDDIIALLAREGYRPFCYDGGAVTPWFAGRPVLDYLFLTSEHCSRLAAASLLHESKPATAHG